MTSQHALNCNKKNLTEFGYLSNVYDCERSLVSIGVLECCVHKLCSLFLSPRTLSDFNDLMPETKLESVMLKS